MNKKNQKGFTLLELIVVLAIIGIIAAILVPTIIRYTRKAAAKTDMANAKQNSYLSNTNTFIRANILQ